MKQNVMRRILNHLVRRWRDPFLIDRDWEDFKAMDDGERRAEFDRLLTHRPCSVRFRRLCQHIALHWRYTPSAKQ